MTKVLVVIARMNVGGTAVYLNNLLAELPKDGYSALLATGMVQGGEIEFELDPRIELVRIPGLGRRISLLRDLLARRSLRKLIKNYKPDIIHTHTFKAGILIRTLKLRIPMVHTFHGHLFAEPELLGWKSRIIQIIEKKLARKTTTIITVGDGVRQELLNRGIGRLDQYLSVPPGVRPIELVPRFNAQMQLNLSKISSPVIVWLARVTSVKAPDRVVELAKRFPSAIFLVIGGGDLLESLKKFESSNLRFLGWQSPELAWSVADIAISTSRNEGMPISLIEAQSAGVPVVALNVGSVIEVIHSEITGYVVDEFDDLYFEKLRELISSPSTRESMGRAAKLLTAEKFSIDSMVSSHIKAYQNSLQGR
jgi:glycosyltransferase involved in cell wall biosynthesis